jgi:hypothetical protein
MAKKIDNKLDEAWSLLVKLVAGNKCEYCGKTSPLNSHHVYSRSKRSTRWFLDNGVCLCVGHHTFSSGFSAHKTPTEFTEWIIEKRGKEWYSNLRLIAHQTMKMHEHEKKTLLEFLQSEIKKLT